MGEDLIKARVIYNSKQMPHRLLSHVQIQIAVHWSGVEGEKEGFRNGYDRLMFRLVSPKGFMFSQDINRGAKKNLPRKIPDMLIYGKMVKIEILGIIAKSFARKAWVCTTSSRCFGMLLSSFIHHYKSSSSSVCLPASFPSSPFVVLVSADSRMSEGLGRGWAALSPDVLYITHWFICPSFMYSFIILIDIWWYF